MTSVSLVNDNSGLKPEFDKLYEYGSEIGKGRYASVKKCYCKKTQKIFAAKVIKNFRTKNAKLNMNIVENEITALTIARPHSSIINLYEVFYHRGETILILEYAIEKDLHIYLDNEGAFEEEAACQIIYQILKAIEFLHSKQVLHLDIKPENVLLMNPIAPKTSPSTSLISLNGELGTEVTTAEQKKNQHKNIKVKLCDFSFSQVMVPGKPILGMMGTVAYSAPEVLQYDALTKATDMWSLGVLVHVILTEYTPFGNGTEELNQTQTSILSVRENEFECIEDYFENISLEAKNFVENLIKFKPKHRLTIEQALNHNWFQNNDSNSGDDAFLVHLAPSNIDIAEDDKENYTQEKNVKINQNNTNNMKLLSENHINNNNNDNLNLNLSINKLKDDKNNNSLSSISESNKIEQENSITQIVTEITLDKKHVNITSSYTSQSLILDKLTTSVILANDNIDQPNIDSAN